MIGGVVAKEPGKADREYDVALSFAGEDQDYVEKVASALRQAGVSVFYDRYEEARLWGVNLYDHLRHVYAEAAKYTVMFISKAYARKLWTNHERQTAQSRAFGESQEYILPARFDDTEVPGLLKTTGYVDLRHKTPAQLAVLIVDKLRLNGDAAEPMDAERLGKNPLFAAALTELRSQGAPNYAIMDAILEETSLPPGLAEFLLLLVRETKSSARLELGGYAIRCIDKFDIGHEAFDFCLAEGTLTGDERERLGMYLQYVTRPAIVRWAHERLATDIRSDTYYNSFLSKHSNFIFEHLAGEMTAYLLVPDRGPGHYNIDSVVYVASRYSKPSPFVGRIREWILDGNFDGKTRRSVRESPTDETTVEAYILYRIINEIAGSGSDQPLQSLRQVVFDRTRGMLETSERLLTGLYHLYVMQDENYVDLPALLSRVYDCPSTDPDIRNLFWQLTQRDRFDRLGETRNLADRLGLF